MMSRSTFFDGIVAMLRKELPEPLRAFRTRRFGHLLKVYFDNERIHYEVWVDSRRQQIELGLHLEEGPASTIAYLAILDQRILEIKDHLGPEAELARWTTSWGHLVECRPLTTLDAMVRAEVARRLVIYVTVLQPMIEDASVRLIQVGGQPGTQWHDG